ncbi:MAG: nicotinamide-nucleotide amidohydrolase family protein [Sphingobacteriaceae bacterium]|nr:nicotinamide-nucleotide amidohydrolase family protein [Sphingobacteriaceae bacterium]
MPAKSVIACCHNILSQDLTIAFVESATTGRLIYDFTSVPDCGQIVKGSIVCYDRSVKEGLLKVPAQVIDKYSAESHEVTQLLAEGLKELIPADIIVAVTGLTSPGGSETEEKPVGTMFIHAIIQNRPWKTSVYFEGSPDEIVAQTIDAIAALLLEELTNN